MKPAKKNVVQNEDPMKVLTEYTFRIRAHSSATGTRNMMIVDDAAIEVNGIMVGIIKRMYLHVDVLLKAGQRDG